MSVTLSQFLREKKLRSEEESGKIDWDAWRDQWLQSVRRLYETIEEWLHDLKEDGTVTISYQTRSLSEEHVGEYETECMVIHVGSERIALEPLGTIIVGAYGRIDLRGSNGNVMLVEPEWKDWQIATRTPRLTKIPLTEESFTDVLKGIMGE